MNSVTMQVLTISSTAWLKDKYPKVELMNRENLVVSCLWSTKCLQKS